MWHKISAAAKENGLIFCLSIEVNDLDRDWSGERA
jgi:hypothetical protein